MTYEAGSNRDIIPLKDRHTDSMGEKGMVEGGSSTDHTATGGECVSIHASFKDALLDTGVVNERMKPDDA